MRQILARVRALRAEGGRAVLATIVAVEGSAYRREGTRMLVEESGALTGVLSGGCLERDLGSKAAEVLASGVAALAVYDLRAPDEILWGLGLGCGGKITVLLEKLPGDPEAPSPLDPFEQLFRDRTPATVETRLGTEVLLRERIVPPLRLVLAGAGRDALPLARLADELGWETVVLDLRPTADAAVRFAGLARYCASSPQDLAAAVTIDNFTAAVVLTHNYLDDLAWLAALLPSAAPYVGLLGPPERRDRLLGDLAMQGLVLDEAMRARLRGPAGLPLGGRSPAEVALAIAAEIQAVVIESGESSAASGIGALSLSRSRVDASRALSEERP
ncbi:MAG: XdhC family protein [Thermoanaerobaculia bacterium]